MSKETTDLQKKKQRIEEIANKFTQGEVTIDEILPLVEETIQIKTEITERLTQIQNALNEKLENAKDN